LFVIRRGIAEAPQQSARASDARVYRASPLKKETPRFSI
jgi:hypothetical protein